MTGPLHSAPLSTREAHLLGVLSSQRFRSMQGLGNEVPFFICPFDPAESVAISKMRTRLVTALTSRGIGVAQIDLYDIAVGVLRQRGMWDRLLAVEPTKSKKAMLQTLQSVLDPDRALRTAVAEQLAIAGGEIVFVTGVGEVFPYVRSHTVLNSLQTVATDRPLLLFFPGEYRQSASKGSSLELFGRLHDDQYYRAFNIFDYTA
mgnify:CR=1 FL=1